MASIIIKVTKELINLLNNFLGGNESNISVLKSIEETCSLQK